MKVKTELLQAFMQKYELSAAILAREMGVTVGEVEKLLGGTAVNEETARRFIYYFGADEAVKMIDWAAIGKQNPLADKGVNYGAGTFPKGRVYRTAERGRFFNAECTPLCKGQRTEQERYDGHTRKSFAPNI